MADISALNVANAYSAIQNQPKQEVAPTTIQESQDFQNSMKVQFNNFAKMSPEQILSHIKISQGQNNNGYLAASNGVISNTVKHVSSTLRKQEDVVRKSLVDEASFVEVLTATTDATNILKTLVEVRNKFVEAHDKIMNMTV